MTPLAAWQNFYVIVGSAAGALVGLQFVALGLIADRPVRADPHAGRAFSTPTIVHFGAVLGLSAIIAAPWERLLEAAVAWGVVGLCGAFYIVLIVRRMRRQIAYRPEFEDWLFHAILPMAAYLTLAAAAVPARFHSREALFAVAAAALVLLFSGIHNAWDAVTYHVFTKRAGGPPHTKPDPPAAPPLID